MKLGLTIFSKYQECVKQVTVCDTFWFFFKDSILGNCWWNRSLWDSWRKKKVRIIQNEIYDCEQEREYYKCHSKNIYILLFKGIIWVTGLQDAITASTGRIFHIWMSWLNPSPWYSTNSKEFLRTQAPSVKQISHLSLVQIEFVYYCINNKKNHLKFNLPTID